MTRFDPLPVLRARQIARVQESVERLDDEIYEAAVNGLDKRVRYLEFIRERVPEWLAAGEARSEALRRER